MDINPRRDPGERIIFDYCQVGDGHIGLAVATSGGQITWTFPFCIWMVKAPVSGKPCSSNTMSPAGDLNVPL